MSIEQNMYVRSVGTRQYKKYFTLAHIHIIRPPYHCYLFYFHYFTYYVSNLIYARFALS